MAIALDGFATLRRIGEQRDVFAPARVEIDKAARVIVLKCLKAKTLDLAGLRAMRMALGDDAFALIVYDLKASETAALLKRLDRHNPDLKTMPQADTARHLMALAKGDAEPAAAPARAGKAKSSNVREPKRLESALMTAFAKGGRRDDEQDD